MSSQLKFDIPIFSADLPYQNQSLKVPGTGRAGETRKSGWSTNKFIHLRNFYIAHYRNAVWSEFYPPGNSFCNVTSTHEAFELGYIKSPKGACLGTRPLASASPLKYADKYIWQTYEQVRQRKMNLGSGVEALFRDGTAGGGELPTVGIWCINRAGAFSSS